jgi:hypothetical protein
MMFSYLLERLAWAIAFTVAIAFFLPWMKVKGHGAMDHTRSEQEKQELVEDADRSWVISYFTLSESELQDALADPLSGTNGFQLLLWARSDHAVDRERAQKLILILGNLGIREASILIYAIPACTLIGACFFTAVPRGRLLYLVPLVLGALLYTLFRTQLNGTYLDRLVLDHAVGLGFWISLYGLLLMTLLLTLRVVVGLGRK